MKTKSKENKTNYNLLFGTLFTSLGAGLLLYICNKNIKNEKFTIVSHNPEDIRNKIKKIISVNQSISTDSINDTETLHDLGVDSLDSVEILMGMEEEFGISIPGDCEFSANTTVSGLIDLVISKLPK